MFFLGTHETSWLARAGVPLFISRRRLARRKRLPVATAPWALDSGGFTELALHGRWSLTPADYVAEVLRFEAEIGQMVWAAPMDWMCEDFVLAKTGKTVAEHQALTVRSYLKLSNELGERIIPVLQGQVADDYLRCIDLYDRAGVDLERAQTIGVGTVCRRSRNLEALGVLRPLAQFGLRLHAFGIKGDSLRDLSDDLVSADSLAWSYRARHRPALAGCPHKTCSNCLRFALQWRERLLESLGQQRLEVPA